MPLLAESLSVWDIAHRWAGYDPDSFRFRHPLLVKDYFKLLLEAVLEGELFCETLTLAKRPADSKADPQYYIRSHLDDINAGIWGVRYNRKLLKWGAIQRADFQEWCETLSIPLPEFWFPSGWKYHFEMPEGGTRAFWAYHVEPDEPGDFALRFDIPKLEPVEDERPVVVEKGKKLRDSQMAKIIARQLAAQLWKEFPDRNITEMSLDPRVRVDSGAASWTPETIQGWIRPVAPLHIRGKRGRPRKKPEEVQPGESVVTD